MQDVEHWCWIGLRTSCGRGYNVNMSDEACQSRDLYDCVGIEACFVNELHGENRHGDR